MVGVIMDIKHLVFGLLLFFNLNIYPIDFIKDYKKSKNIYVFGDSHAYFNYRTRFTSDVEFTSVDNISVLFKIRATSAITMHRVGRDGLAQVNIANFGVTADDLVIFVFGEIDCRCHIGKQRDKYNRDLNEIIDKLATAYINTVLANRDLVPGLTCAVMSVVPPGNQMANPEFPFYGTLVDRVNITRSLNQKLKVLCEQNGLIFIDIYDLYCNAAGALRPELSDGHVHVHPTANTPLKERAIKVLLEHKVL